MNFEICPYNSTNFIYEGNNEHEVALSFINKQERILKRTFYIASPIIFGAGTFFSLLTLNPLPAAGATYLSACAAVWLPALPGFNMANDDKSKLEYLFKATKQIHQYELQRLSDIATTALGFLGIMGEEGQYTDPTQNKELHELEEAQKSTYCFHETELAKVYSDFKKIQSLRKEQWCQQAEKVGLIASAVFQKIIELRQQKAVLAKKLNVPETTEYKPTCAPIVAAPTGLRSAVSENQVHSHFATSRDLQSLAISVIQVAGEVPPDIKSTLLQADKELEAKKVDSASRLHAQAFNTVYLRATRAIDKHKGDLETLKRLEEQQALSNAVQEFQETAQSVAEIVTLIKPS